MGVRLPLLDLRKVMCEDFESDLSRVRECIVRLENKPSFSRHVQYSYSYGRRNIFIRAILAAMLPKRQRRRAATLLPFKFDDNYNYDCDYDVDGDARILEPYYRRVMLPAVMLALLCFSFYFVTAPTTAAANGAQWLATYGTLE